MLLVASIASCVVRGEYRNLVLSATSIEMCSVASIEIFVLFVASMTILCCL